MISKAKSFRNVLVPKKKKKAYVPDSDPANPKPMAVIVVTDIGADIDDTLALFALLGAKDAVKIVAYVTTVNNGILRGTLARGYLRTLGIDDDEIEILPSANGVPHGCHVSKSFATPENSALGEIEKTPERIVEICEKYKEEGVLIYGIASLDPVAKAIKFNPKVMKEAVRGVYLQGNVVISAKGREDPMIDKNVVVTANGEQKLFYDDSEDLKQYPKVEEKLFEGVPVERGKYNTEHPVRLNGTDGNELAPAIDAANYRMAMDAAKLVFETFQKTVPIVTVGKYAAYRVPITVGDFKKWSQDLAGAWNDEIASQRAKPWYETVQADREADRKAQNIVSKPDPEVPVPDLYEMVKSQMRKFYAADKDRFRGIYKVPLPTGEGEEPKIFEYTDDKGKPQKVRTNLSEKDIETLNWWDNYKDYVCCRPYDPLLALKMILDIRKMQDGEVGGADLFEEFKVQYQKGKHHTILGNSFNCNSVGNGAVKIAADMRDLICEGLTRQDLGKGTSRTPKASKGKEEKKKTFPVAVGGWTVNDEAGISTGKV